MTLPPEKLQIASTAAFWMEASVAVGDAKLLGARAIQGVDQRRPSLLLAQLAAYERPGKTG